MAPDFEYFAYGEERGNFGHTWLGMVVWCLPMTVMLGVLFHHLVKWPLLVAAPESASRRLARSAAAGWTIRPLAVIVSALIGTATHDAWDAFTHADGLVVEHWAPLRAGVDVPVVGHMVVHRVLQHGFSVVGIVAVGVVVWRAVRARAAIELPPLPRWRARIVLAVCLAVGGAALEYRAIVFHFARDAGTLVVALISGWLAGLIVASLILRKPGLLARSVSGGRDTNGAWHA